MMINKIYLKLFVITVIAALATVPVFSGCKAEGSTELEINPAESEEATTSEETAEEPDLEEAQEEEDSSEVVQEEDTSQPAQIMDISPAEVFQIMENNEDYLIVDVRTQEEYDSGHLEGAILLPVQELEDRLDELPMGKPIIVYCRSGNRSRTAAETLVANGFTMIYDMGGISSWTAESYPVVVKE